MAFFTLGNKPISSTGFTPVAAPSTATLIAELDSTQLGTKNYDANRSAVFKVAWIVGADTNVTWQLESATSTALSAGQDVIFPKTPTGASAEFVTTHTLTKDMRLRARMLSTGGNASAFIQAEELL